MLFLLLNTCTEEKRGGERETIREREMGVEGEEGRGRGRQKHTHTDVKTL